MIQNPSGVKHGLDISRWVQEKEKDRVHTNARPGLQNYIAQVYITAKM